MQHRRTTVLTALAAVLVVVGVLAAALSGPMSLEARPSDGPGWTPTVETPTLEATALPTPEPMGEPPPVPDVVMWFVRAVVVLAALAGVALLGLLLRYLMRGWRLDDRPDEDVPPGDEAGEELTDTAVAALREGVRLATAALEEDVPPGDAVIAAWVAVETAAARTGVVRDRAQTASEFAVRVLDATRADPAATRALLALYLAARFGTHGVDADDVRRARDLLSVVAQGLVARDGDATVAAGTPDTPASPDGPPPARPDGPAP